MYLIPWIPGTEINGARGGDDHCAGYEEYDYGDQPTDDAGFGPQIACDHQCGGDDLGEPDEIGADIGTEYLKVPTDKGAI